MSQSHSPSRIQRVRRRLTSGLTVIGFLSATLWHSAPLLTLAMLACGVIGGLMPAAQVVATTGLIDALSSQLGPSPAPGLAPTGPLGSDFGAYWPWLLLLVALMIAGNLTAGVQPYLAALLNERSGERLGGQILGKALALPLEWFEHKSNHDLLDRARMMADGSLSTFLGYVQTLISAGLGGFGLLVMFAGAGWHLPLVLLAGSVVLVRHHLKSADAFIEVNYRQTPLQRKMNYWRSLLTERQPAAEARLFGLQEHIGRAWCTLSLQAIDEVNALRTHMMAQGLPYSVISIALAGFVAADLIVAAARAHISVGAAVALLYALRQYQSRESQFGWQLRNVAFFIGRFQYVPELLRQPEEPAGGTPPPPLPAPIRFEDVSFTYPNADRPALSDLNFEIRPGERLALVGENGAGKSTLVRLLLGLYGPSRGRITVGGVDLAELDVHAWRQLTAAVFQDFVRYAFTARENIGFGRVAKLDDADALRRAATASGAEAVVATLPDGMSTLLGKEFAGGQELSYGQWQKLALARAYLRDAPLVVLDEPASALDARAEFEVYRQFRDLSAGKTMLLISHRLGSARLADRIVVLEQGRIVETGRHDELIERGRTYAELYQMQAEWYREEGPDGRAG